MKRSALICLAALLAAPALAADYSAYSPEARGIAAVEVPTVKLPFCDDAGVFRKIASAFADKESEYWQSDARLLTFEQPVEIGYRPWGIEYIPRRFCRARTTVSTGAVHEVYYSVGYKLGTLGVVHGVDWCVTGYDRNLAFAPDCKMAAP